MATDPDRITVAGRVHLFLAPVGTIAPANSAAVLDPAWREVGFTTEDGTSFPSEPEFNDLFAHQSDYAVRTVQTRDSATVQADLMEWSADNFAAVYGGGEASEVGAPGSGEFMWEPPGPGGRDSVAAILKAVDGTKRYLWIVPRCFQREGVENGLPKAEGATLPLRLGVQGQDGVKPWYLLTNDPAFAPAV